jgi:hypothetical protein
MRHRHGPAAPRSGPRRAAARVAVTLVASFGIAALSGFQATTASAQGLRPSGHGWIRFGHFSPSNGPVRVSLDGKVLTRRATFETVTPYDPLKAGVHTVTLTDIGAPHTVLSDKVTVPAGGAVTVGALQGDHGIELKWFDDNLSPGPAGDAKVRIIDTSPTARHLRVVLLRSAGGVKEAAFTSRHDVAVSTVTLATPILPYGTASLYRDVVAGSYTVIVSKGDGRRVITGRDWRVTAGTVASIVIVESHGQATLEVLRDATGASDPPVGGMQTGFGGAADLLAGGHHANDRRDVELILGLLLFGLLALGGSELVRRSKAGHRLAAIVAIGVVGAAASTGALAIGWPSTTSGVAIRTTMTRPATARPSSTRPAASAVSSVLGVSFPERVAHGATRSETRRATSVDLSGDDTGVTSTAPSSLTIGAIGLRTSLVTLGRAADGTAQVPPNTTVAGWYSDGPAPGQPGPAVILGHVDSYTGPGIFFGLHELRPGAVIKVGEGDATLRFEVQEVRTYDKTDFPTVAVFGPTPDRALRLITCGGVFDHATGHYDSNVVVFATEVGAPPANVAR